MRSGSRAEASPQPRFSPLLLLLACIGLAAVATWLLPAGSYARRADPATGRMVAVAGSYAPAEGNPAGPLEALVAIPAGMADAGSVIFFIFLVGGAFAVVDATGALRRSVEWLVRTAGSGDRWVLPMIALAFGAAGAANNTQEEIIAVVPVLLLLVQRFGHSPVMAMAVSLGPAAIGSAFSPVNPFQVGLAQELADVPLLSGAGFRTVFLVMALAIWIVFGLRRARRWTASTPPTPEAAAPEGTDSLVSRRDLLVLALFAAAFVGMVAGVMALGWDFETMAAWFFGVGLLAGGVGGLGPNGTTRALMEGFRSMTGAAMMVGFARAISVVLERGLVLDTIVHGLATPLSGLPPAASALGMMAAHVGIHVPVSSVSGQAALTMPIMAPLADLLGFSRQIAILAYQYGAGLCDMITPTNGSMMAILAAAGVPWDRWVRLAAPVFVALLALGAGAVVLALRLGL